MAGAASVHGAFASFMAGARALAPHFDLAALALEAGALRLDHDGPLTVEGRPAPFAPLSVIPHVAWDGGPLAPLDLPPRRLEATPAAMEACP